MDNKKDSIVGTAVNSFAAVSLIDNYVKENGARLLIPQEYELLPQKPASDSKTVIVNIDCPVSFIAYITLDDNQNITYNIIERNSTGYYSLYCLPNSLVYLCTKSDINYITKNAELLYNSPNSAIFLIEGEAAITAKKDFFEF